MGSFGSHFHEIAVSCGPQLPSSESLMGLEDWLPQWLPYTADKSNAGILMLLGWEEVSVPPHLALFRRHLECPLDMVADFLRSKKSKREPQDLL